MHLTVELVNFKGTTQRYPLNNVTAVIGPNGSGKTSILDAIEFALTGHTLHGKRPEDAAKMFGERGGEVTLILGEKSELRFTRNVSVDRGGRNSVSSALDLPGVHHEDAAADSMLATHLGTSAGTLMSPRLRLTEFAAMSAEKKRETLIGMLESGTTNDNNVLESIDKRYMVRALGAASAGRDDAVSLLSDSQRRARQYVFGTLKNIPLPQSLAAYRELLDGLKAIVSDARKERDRNNHAAQRTSEMLTSMTAVSKPSSALSDELARIEAQIAEVNCDASKIEGTRIAETNLRGRIKKANDEAESLKKNPINGAAVVAHQAVVDRYNDLARSLPPVPDDSATVRAGAEKTAALEIGNEIGLKVAEYTLSLSGMDHHIRQLAASIDAADASSVLQVHDKLQAALVDLATLTEPSINPILSTLRECIALLHAQATELAESRAATAKSLAELRSQRAIVSKLLDETKAAHAQQAEKIEALRRRSLEVFTEFDAVRAARCKAESEFAEQLAPFEASTAAIERWKKTKTRLFELSCDLDTLETSLAELLAQTAPTAGDPELLVSLKSQREAIQQSIKLRTQYENTSLEIENHKEAARNHAEVLACGDAYMDCLRDVREEVIAATVRPLTETAAKFCRACFPDCVGIECVLENERGTPIFDIRWVRPNRPASMNVLSGAESVVFYTGLWLAMLEVSRPKLRLLLADIDAIDAGHAWLFVNAVNQEREAGRIDVAVIATCHQLALEPPVTTGVNEIHLR